MNRTSTPEAAASAQRLSAVWAALESLTDPEIPVLSLREIGILREVREVPKAHCVRDVHRVGDVLATSHEKPDFEVVITPTYSGCPAMGQIEDDVRQRLNELGIRARLVVQMAPAWTTDWMSAAAHTKLREYGIAPPNGHAPLTLHPGLPTHGATARDADLTVRSKAIAIARRAARSLTEPSVPCPRCGSPNTTETSHFGSTACKALYRCLACMEPFDFFKPH